MKNELWATALRVGARLTFWIAAPVVCASFIGKYLDKRYDSEPWLFLVSVGIAFIISMYGLVANALKEFKLIEKAESERKAPNNKEDKQDKDLKK